MQILSTALPALSHYLLQTAKYEKGKLVGEGINSSTNTSRQKLIVPIAPDASKLSSLHLSDSFLELFCLKMLEKKCNSF